MDKMSRILSHDPYACTLTVEAGARLHQLHAMLQQRGMALSCVGSISDQSIGGAIATATHGTGIDYGDISSIVTHLVLIDGTGRRRECSATVDPDLFNAARCNLGALGIVTQVTVQCEPEFILHAVQTPDNLDRVLDNLNQVVISAEHVRFWWFPHTDSVAVWRANRSTLAKQPAPESLLRDRLYGYYYYQLQLFKARFTPDDIPRITRDHFAARFNRRIEWIDDSYKVFNFDCLFPQCVNEWAVPVENAATVLRQLRSWLNAEECKPGGVRVHFPVEVRFVNESDVWLSPAYGQTVCCIGIIMYRPFHQAVPYRKYWRAYEDIMRTQGGRPHWAKAHKMYYHDLRSVYPKFDDFIRVRAECDPSGVFVNDYIRRHILPPDEPLLSSGRDSDPKRQQQRRQQQQKAGQKRKRDLTAPGTSSLPTPAHSANCELKPKGINAYFPSTTPQQKPLQRTGSAISTRPSTVSTVSAALASSHKHGQSSSPFAAAPRVLRYNPFDIIKHEVSLSQDDDDQVACLDGDENSVVGDIEQQQIVIVGASGDLSDSEPEDSAPINCNALEEDWSDNDDDLDGNDPSMYKLSSSKPLSQSLGSPAAHMLDDTMDKSALVLGTAVAGPLKGPSMMQVDGDEGEGGSWSSVTTLGNLRKVANFQNVSVTTAAAVAAESLKPAEANTQLVFSKPPESLSLRTHISITTNRPMEGLEPLRNAESFLSLTSLSGQDGSSLTRVADALVYHEIIGTQASPLSPSLPGKLNMQATTASGGAPSAQIQQALVSVCHLQIAAPSRYPFIYLSMRDYCVVFKVVATSNGSGRSGEAGAFRRVAVVSQSYLGLRKLLRAEGVEYSLPLAPKMRSWSEIPGTNNTSDAQESSDKWLLQTSSFDKTWRSALLIMDGANVDGLLRHLQSLVLDTARLYAPSPFLNATMRQASLRFSSAVAYEGNTDRATGAPHATKTLFKLDIAGVVLPSAWSSILVALAELLGSNSDEFCVAAKELSETAHLNMFVSKQGGSVAGKKSVVCSNGTFTFA
ncbi:D-arabinono-1,4-lactone oxidase [Coemansia thaxteri]|nr:D-arabinono-1,4-lactone oxidase [Coemansia thaxteri]